MYGKINGNKSRKACGNAIQTAKYFTGSTTQTQDSRESNMEKASMWHFPLQTLICVLNVFNDYMGMLIGWIVLHFTEMHMQV